MWTNKHHVSGRRCIEEGITNHFGSWWSVKVEASSLSGLGYSIGLMINIGSKVSHSYWKIGESTWVSSANGWYDFQGLLSPSSMSLNDNVHLAHCYFKTLYATNAHRNVNISPTVFNLYNTYHSCALPTILGYLYFATFPHSSSVFPYKIDCSQPTSTFSVISWQIIATPTDIKILSISVQSVTITPCISKSLIPYLTINHNSLIWWASNLAPGQPGIKYFKSGTKLFFDKCVRLAFSSLIGLWRHTFSTQLWFEWRTVLSSELLVSGSRTFFASTCFWNSFAHLCVLLILSINCFIWN